MATKTPSDLGRSPAIEKVHDRRKQRQHGHGDDDENDYDDGNDNNRRIETSRSTSEDMCSMRGGRDENRDTLVRNQQVLVGPHYHSSLVDNCAVHYLPDIYYSPQPATSPLLISMTFKRNHLQQDGTRMLLNNANLGEHLAIVEGNSDASSCNNYFPINGGINYQGQQSQYQQQQQQQQQQTPQNQLVEIRSQQDTNSLRPDNLNHQYNISSDDSARVDNFDTKITVCSTNENHILAAASSDKQPPSAHSQNQNLNQQQQHGRGIKRDRKSTTKSLPKNSGNCSSGSRLTSNTNNRTNSNWSTQSQTTSQSNISQTKVSPSFSGTDPMDVDQVASGRLPNENNHDEANNSGHGSREQGDDDCETDSDNDEEIDYELILTKILNEKKLALTSSQEVIRFICCLHERNPHTDSGFAEADAHTNK